jgi:hypothetical protein
MSLSHCGRARERSLNLNPAAPESREIPHAVPGKQHGSQRLQQQAVNVFSSASCAAFASGSGIVTSRGTTLPKYAVRTLCGYAPHIDLRGTSSVRARVQVERPISERAPHVLEIVREVAVRVLSQVGARQQVPLAPLDCGHGKKSRKFVAASSAGVKLALQWRRQAGASLIDQDEVAIPQQRRESFRVVRGGADRGSSPVRH